MKAAAFFVTVFAYASIALSLSQSDARLDCSVQGDLLASLGRSKGPLSNVQRSCNGRIVVETRVDSRVLELKLVGQRDCTNKTYQVELEGSVKVVVGERGCSTAIHKRGRRLVITRRSGVCFDNIRVLSCKNARTERRPHLSRRWLPSHNKQSTRGIVFLSIGISTVVTGAGSLLLYAGLVLVIAIASVTSLIGCCLAKSGRAEVTQEKPALPVDSDRKSSKSNSLSSSCEKEKYNQYLLDPPFCEDPSPYSCGPSPSPSTCSSQSSSPPITESFGTKASYLSDSGIEGARHYLANRELPKPEDAGVEVDAIPSPVAKPEETDNGQHIYFKLDGFQPTCALELRQEDEEDSQEETNLDLVGGARNSLIQKPRKYFVLEVTENGPKMRESIDDDVTTANKLFEPPHEDEPQICSVCKQLVHSKQDSLYLVILPDEGSSEHKLPFPQATCPLPSHSANVCYQSHEGDAPEEPQQDGVDKTEQSEPHEEDKPEQIYYSLDVPPPVVCMQCVYSTEEEPLYNEVDEPLIDPIYEKIKIANARQDTTVSHSSSHTYASVPSIDHGQSEEDKLLVPPRSLALQRDAREASEDYASIPSSPIYSQPELKPHVDIYDVVCSLRHKMKLRRQQSQQQQQHSRSSSPDPPPPSPPSPPVRDSSLHTTRSRTATVDRPFVVAQRKRTGSYLMMNLDSIWQHQQANRYAPVSIGKQTLTKTPSREAYPMRETQKRMFEYFKLQQQHAEELPTVSDYEVPVRCTIPAAPQEKIPPPLLLQKLIRQSAVDSQLHESSKKLFRHTSSEPCLLSADKENSFDVLHKEQLSPPSSPSSDIGDQQATTTSYDYPASPNKSPLKRMSYPFL